MKEDNVNAYVREVIGTNIAKARQGKFSQAEFARRFSIDRSYLNQIECGKRNASIDVLVKIADGLGVSLTVFFAGLEDYAPQELFAKKVEYAVTQVPSKKKN